MENIRYGCICYRIGTREPRCGYTSWKTVAHISYMFNARVALAAATNLQTYIFESIPAAGPEVLNSEALFKEASMECGQNDICNFDIQESNQIIWYSEFWANHEWWTLINWIKIKSDEYVQFRGENTVHVYVWISISLIAPTASRITFSIRKMYTFVLICID